jgi:hypothetical protein
MYRAAIEAKRLGFKKISVIEFGVAGGNGLIFMENVSLLIKKHTGIEINCYGFDLVKGLPEPANYKDLPHIWKKGFYKMDEAALRKKIKKSKLILGDVKKTIPEFNKKEIAPIGFITFDLDFYSSTKEAFQIFKNKSILPRTFLYFDDIIGTEEEDFNEYVGELLAINEYNSKEDNKKITKIAGLRYKRHIPAQWNEQIYIHNDFHNKLYNQYIYEKKERQNVLKRTK